MALFGMECGFSQSQLRARRHENGGLTGGASFGMVDAVFAPMFRYFDIIPPAVAQPIFHGLPRVLAWRAALAARESVIAAVGSDYAERFRLHLRQHQALLAEGH